MLQRISESVITGNASDVADGVERALEAGYGPAEILNKAMIVAMTEVGRRFECQEFFVPEMLLAARAMQRGLAILKPLLIEADVPSIGKVVLGTASGDLHDIGKNLVGMMLEGAGFEVIDLGTDVSPERFLEAVREHKPRFVGISALLTTTMVNMRRTIDALQEAGLAGEVKVMVGGAPVTEEFADQIGADMYAPDAASAASRATAMLSA
jgi:5-methyltetrahydrofolate--homocysteine methyltransferase